MEISECALCANVLAGEKLTPEELKIIRPLLKSVTLDTTFIPGLEESSSVFCGECESLLQETKRLKVLLTTVTSQLVAALAKVKVKYEGRAVWVKVEDASDIESDSSVIGFSIAPINEDEDDRSVGIVRIQERSVRVKRKSQRSVRIKQKENSDNDSVDSVESNAAEDFSNDPDFDANSSSDDEDASVKSSARRIGFSRAPLDEDDEGRSVGIVRIQERSVRVKRKSERSVQVKQKEKSDNDSVGSNATEDVSNDPDFDANSSSDDNASVKSSTRKRKQEVDSDSDYELTDVKKPRLRKTPARRSQTRVSVKNKKTRKPEAASSDKSYKTPSLKLLVDKIRDEVDEDDDYDEVNPTSLGNNRTRVAKCRFCGLYVKSGFFAICIHERKEHPEKFTRLCATCGSTFAQENEVLTCQETHKESSSSLSEQFKCFVCNDKYDDGDSLRDHLESRHTEGGSKCNECGQRFKDIQKMQKHKAREHGDELPLKCPICGKGHIHQSVLDDHIRGAHKKHPDQSLIPPPISCDKCEKTFHSRITLYYHRKKVHDGHALFTCEQCGKKLRCARTLEIHKKAHLGIRTHECEVCGRQLSTFPAWRIHMRIHTGETPFKCHICDTGCKQRQALNRHFERHKKDGTWKEKVSDFAEKVSDSTKKE